MKPEKKLKLSRIPHAPAASAGENKGKPEDTVEVSLNAEEEKPSAENAAASPEPDLSETVVYDTDSLKNDGDGADETEKIDISMYEPKDEYAYTFDESLDDLTAEQIDPDGKSKKKGFPVLAVVRAMMIVICLGIFVYCAFIIGHTLIDYHRTDVIYDQFAEKFFSLDNSEADGSSRLQQVNADGSVPDINNATSTFINGGGNEYIPPISSSDNPFDTNPEKMIQNLTLLKEIAPDLYGWIYVAGTNINYPIVRTNDNVFYLNHDAAGGELVTGAIFADFRCNPDDMLRNFNTVLYGHNIRSGQMFHAVEDIFNSEAMFRSKEVIICSFDGILYFKPFSVFHTSYDTGYNDVSFQTLEEAVAFANDMQNQSVFESNYDFDENDRLLTLSTCTNGLKTDRYGLMCVLTKYEPVSNS